MEPLFETSEEAVPEHSLAALHGLGALVVGAAAWSGAAAVFGPWALPAAAGLGWLVAWSCRYGGRALDTPIRVIAWLLSLAAVLSGLAALSVFSVLQAAPDASLDPRQEVAGAWSLFAEPPWFGSAAVLLALVGAGRALRVPAPPRPAAAERAAGSVRELHPSGPPRGRPDEGAPTSRVA